MTSMKTSGRLPMDMAGVTTAWMSEALSSVFPGVEVTSLTVDKVIEGTATKLRLLLAYNSAGTKAGLPPTMWLKIGFNPVHLEIASVQYEAEATFYRDFAAQIDGLKLPRCYYAKTDKLNGQSAILLEDLEPRHIRFGDIREPVGLDVVRNLLDWMAILHARYWRDPMLSGLRRLSPDKIVNFPAYVLQPDHWAKYMAGPRAVGVPDNLRNRDTVADAYLALLRANHAITPCLIHGDVHAGNMFFEPDGTAGFVDWQGVMAGAWAKDVGYFLTGFLTVADRRKHEKDLLTYYLTQLGAHMKRFGVNATPPSWDEAWLSHRRNQIHGYLWIACPESTQPEEICALNAERFAASAIDLDTLGALASVP